MVENPRQKIPVDNLLHACSLIHARQVTCELRMGVATLKQALSVAHHLMLGWTVLDRAM